MRSAAVPDLPPSRSFAGGSGPVDPFSDDDGIPGAHIVESRGALGSFALHTGGLLGEDLLAAYLSEGIVLHFGVLILGRDTGIADQHGALLVCGSSRETHREHTF